MAKGSAESKSVASGASIQRKISATFRVFLKISIKKY